MAIPFLNNINLSDNELQNAKLHVTSSAPTEATGQIYYNSSSNVVLGTFCVIYKTGSLSDQYHIYLSAAIIIIVLIIFPLQS